MQIKNLKWANAKNTLIDLEINHPQYGWIPFTADPNDIESYGRQLFVELSAGQFGPIAKYVASPPYVPTSDDNKTEAERRLQATDWVNQSDVYDSARDPHLLNRDEFLDYRAWCRNVAVNPVAGNINWPIVPAASWSKA